MESLRIIEKQKYIDLFLDKNKEYFRQNSSDYGHKNHARKFYSLIKKMKIDSVCDVGCGCGEFCEWMNKRCSLVFGLDIASVRCNKVIPNNFITYIDSDATSIPLPDNTVEFVTSFDCLEHCLPEDVPLIFQEFARVASKGFLLKIKYRQSHNRGLKGELLHLTVKKKEYWFDQISKYAEIKEIDKSCLLCMLKPQFRGEPEISIDMLGGSSKKWTRANSRFLIWKYK